MNKRGITKSLSPIGFKGYLRSQLPTDLSTESYTLAWCLDAWGDAGCGGDWVWWDGYAWRRLTDRQPAGILPAKVGSYYFHDQNPQNTTAVSLNTNFLYAWQREVKNPICVDQLLLAVSVVDLGATGYYGLYSNTTAEYPGSLLNLFPSAGQSMGGSWSVNISPRIMVPPGLYWDVLLLTGGTNLSVTGQATIARKISKASTVGNSVNRPNRWAISSALSSLPSTFPSGATLGLGQSYPMFGWRAA